MSVARSGAAGSFHSEPVTGSVETDPLPSTLHFELFLGKRHNNEIRVPCRCSIGGAHTHEEWLDAGRPPITGKPRRKRHGV